MNWRNKILEAYIRLGANTDSELMKEYISVIEDIDNEKEDIRKKEDYRCDLTELYNLEFYLKLIDGRNRRTLQESRGILKNLYEVKKKHIKKNYR